MSAGQSRLHAARMRNIVQALALHVAAHPLGRRLLLLYYNLALRVLALALRARPEVLGIYERTKKRAGTSRPGMSDLDVTVVIDAAGGSAAALRFVSGFWRLYDGLRRAFPMLGEIEILTRPAFEDLLAFGPSLGSAIKRIRPVYQRVDLIGAFDPASVPPREPQYLRRVIHRAVVFRYLRFVLPRTIQYVREPTRLNHARMRHVHEQMAYRVEALGARIAAAAEPLPSFVRLLAAIQPPPSSADPRPAVLAPDAPVVAIPPACRRFSAALLASLDDEVRAGVSIVAWNCFGVEGRCTMAVIVPDELREADLLNLFDAHRRAVAELEVELGQALHDYPLAMPALVTSSAWRAWMATQPFEHAEFAARGHTLHGCPPELGPPMLADCTDFVVNEYTSLLSLHNNWRGQNEAGVAALYRELIDQMDVYLHGLAGEAIRFDYPRQRERKAGGVADLHAAFADRLVRLRAAIVDHLRAAQARRRLGRSARPLASIVVPAFNAEATLGDCIESILSGDVEDIELIICSDGSDDRTEDLVRDWERRDARVRLVACEERQGPAHARNRAIAAATAPFVFFTDADVVADRSWIAEGLAAFSEPDVVGVEGDVFLLQAPADVRDKVPINPFYEKGTPPGRLNVPGQDFAASNIAYRRETLDALGGFNAARYLNGREDTDLGWRALRQGRIAYRPAMRVKHQRSRWSMGGLLVNACRYAQDVKFLRDHGMFFFRRGRVLHPELLRMLVWPPLTVRRLAPRSIGDVAFLMPFYVYLVLLRLHIWRAGWREGMLVL
jgi:glycosyltransferase involved in cell wall biosynthesis